MNRNFSKYFSRLFLLSLVIVFLLLKPSEQDVLKFYFLDVGQGDSELIVMPSGQTVLIDGGPNVSLVPTLDKILPFTRRQIDLLVLTHPHDDHLVGLLDVLKTYSVKEVLWTGVSASTSLGDPANTLAFREFAKIIAAKKIKTTIARQGLVWQFAASSTVSQIIRPALVRNLSPPTLTVLYPFTDVSKQTFADLNASSIVLRLDYQQSSALLMGDLPAASEVELLKTKVKLSAQVLKVGHHGSAYSSSLDFLQAVKPDWSIVSCGRRNLFHHPAASTLARLLAVGSQVLITKDIGTIALKTSGDGRWTRLVSQD